MSVTAETLALAVDAHNRYPGELATFFIRFTAPEQKDVSLQFAMPKVMEIESHELPAEIPHNLPSVVELEQDLIFLLPLGKHFMAGQTYEISMRVRINTFYFNQYLVTEARLVGDDGITYDVESLQVAVYGKGKYLQYLPELYDSDEFTSRFLMLFESFWKPISQQIDQMEYYFDPDITPAEFVPWLASWVGLPLDSSLPMERMRAMLKQAIMLFQCRGTYQALQTYLEIYTNGKVAIKERRSQNFILGPENRLGVNVAVGKDNQPNSIFINLMVPQEELLRSGYSETVYKNKMQEIIRAMVPAHTIFDVTCAFETQKG